MNHHRRNEQAARDELASQRSKVELVREEYAQAKERALELWAAGCYDEARFVAAQARAMRQEGK